VIRERQQQGHTAILVSHLLSDIEQLCNRVAVIREGRVGFLGNVAELKGELAAEPVDAADSSFEDALEPFYAGAHQ
jgi:ABC-2 type transport system ATP-binding protein